MALIIAINAALCCGVVNAQVPREINYQGYLTAAGGTPVNANVNMVFSLYNSPSGGAALYSESQNSVTVSNGVFNVLIGSVTPIPPAVLFDVPYWLGIAVGTDPAQVGVGTVRAGDVAALPHRDRPVQQDRQVGLDRADEPGGADPLGHAGEWPRHQGTCREKDRPSQP